MKMTNTNQHRIWGLDFAKALAAFFIVLYHLQRVDFGFIEGQQYVPNLTKCLWSFCVAGVPLFFMINGALTVKKYDFRKMTEKVCRLLFISVIWGVIFKIGFLDGVIHRSFDCSLKNFYNYYWFFYTLAALYVIDYILQKCPKWCETAILIILLICPFMTNLFWEFYIFVFPSKEMPSWGHIGLFTMYGYVYHRMGYFLKRREIPTPYSAMLIAIGLFLVIFEVYVKTNHDNVMYDGVNSSFPTIGALCLTTGIFMIFKRLNIAESQFKRLITIVGNCALGVYLFHLPLIFITHMLVQQHTIDPILAILLSLLIVIFATIVTYLLSRSPLKFTVKL